VGQSSAVSGNVGDCRELAESLAGQKLTIQGRIQDLGPLRTSTGALGVIGMNLLRE
jgi:hypothetical protein